MTRNDRQGVCKRTDRRKIQTHSPGFDFLFPPGYTFTMKQLDDDIVASSNKEKPKAKVRPGDISARLIEVVPLLTRHIRGELRNHTMPGLSLPQYRALTYLRRHPQASLTEVAAHLNRTPPTVSKMIQKLVDQGIIERRVPSDRRRVCLSLSEEGVTALARAREETRQQLTENLRTLSQEELYALSVALNALGRVFTGKDTGVNIP